MVKGGAGGVTTDFDGEYTIAGVKPGDVIVVSLLGYEDQEIVYNGQARIDVVLNVSTEFLDEVVVTALGIKRSEKALSYNVQKVDSEELLRAQDVNFVNSLNGKIAGVQINKSAGGAGGATRVIMRGAKSLEGDNNVLYVIDGIPMINTTLGSGSEVLGGTSRATTEGIADFNPEDIESISVLTGPSAAALYGSSAANGVILINTKKGKEGKVSLSFSTTSEFSTPYMTPDFQNIYGNRQGAYESWGNKLATPSSYDPKKDFFETGMTFINSLSLTMGNKHNQTFASISSSNSQGIVPNNKYDRINASVRNTSSILNDKVQIDLGASFVHQTDQNMVTQGLYNNPVVAAYLFPRGESWDAVKSFERYNQSRAFATQYWPIVDNTYATDNPYWTAFRNTTPSTKNRYMFNVGITYNILDWLNVSARYRLDDTNVEFERKYAATTNMIFTEGSDKGLYEYSNFRNRQQYADAMLNINKHLGDFHLMVNLGYSFSDYHEMTRGYRGPLKLVPNKFTFSNIDPAGSAYIEDGGDAAVRNNAVFANVELGWKNMLFLTLTGRNDWNSRLVGTSSEKPGYFYPSVGLSAVISEMVEMPKWFSYLKVRGSYAEVGSPVTRSGLTPGTVTTKLVGGLLQENGRFPFVDFEPEKTKSYEFGLEFRLWNSLSAQLTYYHSNTYNQTFLAELPEYSGFKEAYLQAGNVANSGWEASLGYDNTVKGVRISSLLTFSRNVNVIKEMVHDFYTEMSLDPINVPEVLKDNGRIILKEGGSLSDIYADTFLKKDSQGYVEVKDGNYSLEKTDPVYLGKTTPDFNLGWNNSISYKGFTLSFLLNGRFGGIVTSSTEAIMDRFGVSKASAEARENGGYMLPNQGMVDAEGYFKKVGTGDFHTSGYYTYSATNIRLQEVTFGYTFPNKWFKNVLKDLTLTFIANNPWMIYCKAPFDPELTPTIGTYGQGNDYFMQPSVRSYAFSLKFKF
ncbi:MAG: SusC/RagA family TonB-linked outer membrane protein [Bacteroidales bacterium]|nr:SusC/RagA family TonB-linked outer membrane protein [Bacteroides sp.]MCM1503207.1 SusC/RagA family TonB-linked outer membrane protein [Bacteroidales bacterium]